MRQGVIKVRVGAGGLEGVGRGRLWTACELKIYVPVGTFHFRLSTRARSPSACKAMRE